MTGEVGGLVLSNNYQQTLALSIARKRGLADIAHQSRFMTALEARGLLNRAVETLPSPAALAEREARGEPLTDALREGWLDAIGERIAASIADGQRAVAACSALKRSYRDRLRRFCPGIVFLYLKIDRETAWRRVAARKGHFMPASLVDSQFATLEEPGRDEQAVTVDATRTVAGIARQALG
ncbi:gluconokinase [Mesorhizobium sp. M1E.F.Ca.ET.063.01.1.1]|nr:gluconokinase [Mesorhizobium sp. M1E.F.Ca.ET.063.01.1.1]